MCFYGRMLGALVGNLALRLWTDFRDWLVLARRRFVYRLGSCVSSYDDVGPEDFSFQGLLCDQANLGAGLEGNSWFVNADRKTAQELVMSGGEGCFLVRKSNRYPLTLTVKHHTRPFNIPVRRREDGKIALGSRKHNERTFGSVEELVAHYGKEELILFSGGEKAGKVALTSPPAQSDVERKCKQNCHHIMVHVPQ